MIFKKNNTNLWLVVGLGNPGMQYEETRHNVGFKAADRLAEKQGASFNKHKFGGVYGEFKAGDNRVLLLKPQTYMNNSGTSVQEIASFYKIPTDRIIVMFDDISLDIGKIRIRRKGSHGGHNGIKDIIALMGTDEITRIKIGVGERTNPDYDLADWVLSKIPKEDADSLDEALDNAVRAVGEIISRGVDSAMNKYSK